MNLKKKYSFFHVINKNQIVDLVFVVLFFVCLCIPMTHISNAQKSEREMRMLAKLPGFTVDGKINNKYGEQFNNWFNDRFCGRKQLIKFNSSLRKMFNFDGDSNVLMAENNWLFYKGDSSLDNYQNKHIFNSDELKYVGDYLVYVNNWAKENSKLFYFIIPPDKNKIYGENIRFLQKMRPDSESRANKLVEYLNNTTDVRVNYLYDAIATHKNEQNLLYFKHDTHWNAAGAYFAYEDIINMINRDINVAKAPIYGYKEIVHSAGDLYTMINGQVPKDETKYMLPQITDESWCEYLSPDKDETKGVICYNKSKKLNVFVLRDSFSNTLMPFYNNTFGKVRYEWRYNITESDLNEIKNNYDIIILETVERYLPNLLWVKFPKI